MKRYKFDFAAGSNHSSSIRHQSKIVSPLSSKLVRLFNTSGLFVLHMLAFQVSAPSSNQIIWLMISLFQLCIKCLLNLSLGQDQDTRTIFSLISVEGIEWIASYLRMKPQIVRCVMLAFNLSHYILIGFANRTRVSCPSQNPPKPTGDMVWLQFDVFVHL